MNVGFREAMREEDWDCLFFHDVDLIPEDDRNTYVCESNPKHAVIAMDKFGYKCVVPCALQASFETIQRFFCSPGFLCCCCCFSFLKTSIQNVLWWSCSSDSAALPENERLPKQLLGLGRRGRRHFSQVGFFQQLLSGIRTPTFTLLL